VPGSRPKEQSLPRGPPRRTCRVAMLRGFSSFTSTEGDRANHLHGGARARRAGARGTGMRRRSRERFFARAPGSRTSPRAFRRKASGSPACSGSKPGSTHVRALCLRVAGDRDRSAQRHLPRSLRSTRGRRRPRFAHGTQPSTTPRSMSSRSLPTTFFERVGEGTARCGRGSRMVKVPAAFPFSSSLRRRSTSSFASSVDAPPTGAMSPRAFIARRPPQLRADAPGRAEGGPCTSRSSHTSPSFKWATTSG